MIFYYFIEDNGDGSASLQAFQTWEQARDALNKFAEEGLYDLSEGEVQTADTDKPWFWSETE